MDLRSTKLLDEELSNITNYLKQINEKIAKVHTINSLTLFSTVVNSFPLETPGIEEAAQMINDLFFPQPQAEEDGLAYLFSHKDFVSLTEDLANLTKIFTVSEPQELLCSEKRHCSDGLFDTVISDNDDFLHEVASSVNGNDDKIKVEVKSNEENENVWNNIESDDQETELTPSYKTSLPTSGQVLAIGEEDSSQPLAITAGVTSSNKETDETFQANRQHLKELIVWIFEEATNQKMNSKILIH